jgi:hypothetical protein
MVQARLCVRRERPAAEAVSLRPSEPIDRYDTVKERTAYWIDTRIITSIIYD